LRGAGDAVNGNERLAAGGQLDLLPPEGIDWSRVQSTRRVWLEDVGGDHRARMEFLADQGLRLVMADLDSTEGETLHFSSPRDGETLHLRAGGGKSLLEEAKRYFPAAARWIELLYGGGDMSLRCDTANASLVRSGLFLEVEAGRVARVTESWRDYPQGVFQGTKAAQAVFLLEQGGGLESAALAMSLLQALEEARGMKVPPAALAIRAVLLESARARGHLQWMGAVASALGRLRISSRCEGLCRDLESATEEWLGDPLGRGWVAPGGVGEDFPLAGAAAFAAGMAGVAVAWDELSTRASSIPVPRWLERRLRPLHAEAEKSAWTGPLARAAGIDVDARKEEPGVFAVAGWEEAVPPAGTGIFRRMLALRAGEVASSLGFMVRVLSDLPEPPLLVRRGRGSRSEGFGRCEGPDGEVCCHAALEKGKVRCAAFSLPRELNRSAARILEGCRLDELDLISLLWRGGF
jgi:Ni,Fe-hydrogenase III large subunit